MSHGDLGRAILRLASGMVFVAHGLQKAILWGWSGGVPFFRDAGIPLATVAAPLVTIVEVLGGLALLAGLATRSAASVLALVMLVALATVHFPHGFFLPDGVEFVLTLALLNTAIVVLGPGRVSIDHRLDVKHRAALNPCETSTTPASSSRELSCTARRKDRAGKPAAPAPQGMHAP